MSSSSSSSSSSSVELDLEGIVSLNMVLLNAMLEDRSLARNRASATRRRATINRHRAEGHDRLYKDYFAQASTYNERQFRGRFRMTRPLFLRIVDALRARFPYFQQRPDGVGRMGLSPLQKCTAAMRMLAYGLSADAVDDYVRIGRSTAQECLNRFVNGIITIFGDEYLRSPTNEDTQRLLSVGAARGFPGMLGSIDCMHWEWKNCPSAWKGQYSRGDHGKPTIVLEAVASYDTWIWHAFFGVPGTCNDINVLDRSPLFDELLDGRSPPVEFMVNGHQYNLGYYLADGIYPSYPTFVQSVRHPLTEKTTLFAKQQEAARKDVERAFGILQARFAIIKGPSRMHQVREIGKIMRACIILHNMIVEDEGHRYSTQYEFAPYDHPADTSTDWGYATGQPVDSATYYNNRSRARDREQHAQLKNDLIEHIWARGDHP